MAGIDRLVEPNDEWQENVVEALSRTIAACRICRDVPARGIEDRLPHEPRPVATLSTKAKILIAGQAPGLRVHESGLPFNDASGDRLRDWLGVNRDEFYNPDNFAILPMGFCFPGYDEKGHDLPPRRECAPLWRRAAVNAMPQIELVLAIGLHAQKWHMGKMVSASMTQTVHNWRQSYQVNTSPRIFPLPHPSWRNSGWLKRNEWFATELLPVLRQHVDSLIR